MSLSKQPSLTQTQLRAEVERVATEARLAPGEASLLRYLMEASLSERTINASTIHEKLFPHSVASSGRVPVLVAHLRKKLDHFYADRTSSPPFRVSIETRRHRGYALSFSSIAPPPEATVQSAIESLGF